MPTLLLRLAGPLQSWGVGSRFTTRGTETSPTKSGVVGLLSAALGIPRNGSLERFAGLGFGTRTDVPGTLLDDFHTAISMDGKTRLPLTHRHYLQDAVFVAGFESDDAALLESFAAALRAPVFPLSLGRRSCPPDGPIVWWIVDTPLEQSLKELPWQATPEAKRSARRRARSGAVRLPLLLDARGDDGTAFVETLADEPLSFDPQRRRYATRAVVRSSVTVEEATATADTSAEPTALAHDPMAMFAAMETEENA